MNHKRDAMRKIKAFLKQGLHKIWRAFLRVSKRVRAFSWKLFAPLYKSVFRIIRPLGRRIHRLMAQLTRRIDRGIQCGFTRFFKILYKIKIIRPVVKPIYRVVRAHHRISAAVVAIVFLGAISMPLLQIHFRNQRYELNEQARALVGEANTNLTEKLTFDDQKLMYQFNKDAKKTSNPSSEEEVMAQLKSQVGGGGKDDEQLYSVDIPMDLAQGATYYDNQLMLNFKITPQFETMPGKQQIGHLVYPLRGLNGQLTYTLDPGGLKESIILYESPGDELSMSYTLDVPKSMEAKLIEETGEIGIYTADPSLFGSITYGSEKDQKAVENARMISPKNYLAFKIPAPIVLGVDGNNQTEASAVQSRFTLAGDTLTVHTKGLDKASYPLSIDPTVSIDSTSDFQTGNMEDNNGVVDSGTLSRGGVTGGSVGSFNTTTSLPTTRNYQTSIVYNGYLYVIGDTSRNIHYAPINSNGTVGSWSVAGSNFPTNFYEHTSAVYNGYLYIIQGNQVHYAPINTGGTIGAWAYKFTPSGSRSGQATAIYNGYLYYSGGRDGSGWYNYSVHYAPINSDGSIGVWNTTTNLSGGGGLAYHTSVAYNGYLYVIGGYGADDYSITSGVQYAPINSDGSIGVWKDTTSYNTLRIHHTSAIYNGYLYIAGGRSIPGLSDFNDVQYAPINSDGSIGVWNTTTSFISTNPSSSSVAYNGYIYIVKGNSSSSATDVQYAKIDPRGVISKYKPGPNLPSARYGSKIAAYNGCMYVTGGFTGSSILDTVHSATIDATTGALGTWTSRGTFTTARYQHASLAYNGYLYIIGGWTGSASTNTILRAAINTNCTLGSWTSSTFPTARDSMSVVAYNGYMYILGGSDGSYYNLVHRATINATTGALGTWTSSTGFTTARNMHASIAYNGYLYVIGGTNGSGLSDIQYASINSSNGSLGAWNTTTALPSARWGHGAVVNNGMLYIVGGSNGSSINETYYAPLNTNGTITSGSWKQTESLSVARDNYGVIAYNGYIYTAGGYTSGMSQTFNYTGSHQTYTVPAGVTSVQVDARGAQGYTGASTGGRGGRVQTTLAVTPGQTLDVVVGGGTNGYNGGGSFGGRFGGGASDIRVGGTGHANRVIVAGGGGGSGNSSFGNDGYPGGGTTGGGGSGCAGGGGTQSTGGAGGTSIFGNGAAGSLGVGGNGYTNGGGGGGGYYGGGGGGGGNMGADCQGGGGSSYAGSGTSSTTHTQGYQSGNGQIIISYGSGLPAGPVAKVEYAKINNGGTGALGNNEALTGGGTYSQRYGHALVACNGHLYSIGGHSGSAYLTTVQSAKVTSAGMIETWTSRTALPSGRAFHAAVCHNNNIYVLGGQTGASSYTNQVLRAAVNSDGSLSSWTADTSLTSARAQAAAVVYNDRLYTLGGTDGGPFYSYFYYTGDQQEYVVPAGVTSVRVVANGAMGGIGDYYIYPAEAGYIEADLSVTPGETLYIEVGGYGGDPSIYYGPGDGYNGGGASTYDGNTYYGGGASDIRQGGDDLADRVIVAGGGGASGFGQLIGYGYNSAGGVGGDSAQAGDGADDVFGGYCSPGLGATDSAGGAAGSIYGTPGSDGSLGQGGDGGVDSGYGGGGGGGGYYGGGGGSVFTGGGLLGCGGGGGTNYAGSGTSNVTEYSGYSYYDVNGYIEISYGTGATSTVQYADINSNGTIGSWQSTTSVPQGLRGHASLAYNGYMYAIGGVNTSNAYQNTIYKALINSNGTIGSWSLAGRLERPRAYHMAVAQNGYIYAIGGRDASGALGATVNSKYGSILSNGNIEWVGDAAFSGFAPHETGFAVYNGWLYVLGGRTGTTVESTQWRYGFGSIPRKFLYSKVIDLSTPSRVINVGFTGSLPAGDIQNLSYKVAASDGVFGSVQKATESSSCAPGGSAQYVQVFAMLDDSSTDVYGGASSNNAVVDSITINSQPATAPPDKRLRHGAWFDNNVLRPFDTGGSSCS